MAIEDKEFILRALTISKEKSPKDAIYFSRKKLGL